MLNTNSSLQIEDPSIREPSFSIFIEISVRVGTKHLDSVGKAYDSEV